MNISEKRRKVKSFRRESIRKKISGTTEKPRISLFKSNKNIFIQVIDDIKGHTLVAASTLELKKKESANVETCKELGKKVGELAKEKGIENCVFDRGGNLYHGKVKAVADGIREIGIKI